MHDFVVAQAALAGNGEGAAAGVDGEDAAFRAGGIFGAAEGGEEEGAERDPTGVEQPEAANHAAMIRIVTRGEIEEKLVAIIRQEKTTIAPELIKPETPLAEAGIDSLDSLTILFAIEEQFHISIPDDRARAVTTFGDLINVVQDLLPAA